jgi:formylglycine-generating enzyme required for sulfatase activity
LVSGYGLTIADGTSTKPFHGELFAETLGKVGKRLLKRDEFIVVAKGSNELTNIYGSTDPNTTGGHVDTNSRRMISNYGLEDCCGAMWQWGADCYEFYPGGTWSSGTQYLGGAYVWQEASVYHSGTDSQKYGSCDGLFRRVILGGHWRNASYCGSRCADCSNFSARGGDATICARGASEPMFIS